MADVAAYHLTEEEKQRLLDPAVGGVILFRRNFENVSQLKLWFKKSKPSVHLNSSSPSTTKADGFNVFIDGFTRLPAMNVLGEIWDNEGQEAACAQAEQVGWVFSNRTLRLRYRPILYACFGFGLGSMRRHR